MWTKNSIGSDLSDPVRTDLINKSVLSDWFWNELFSKEKLADELLREIRDHDLIHQFQSQINYQFKNPDNLITAICHRSFLHEVKGFELNAYERFEFLGDSFLNYYVSKKLYQNLPLLKEGQWSKLRGAIVNTSSLHDISNFLGMSQLLLTGRGDVTTKENLKQKIYADILESLVGAIIIDSDEESAWDFMEGLFEQYQAAKEVNLWDEGLLINFDFKSQLQEILMRQFKETPIYESYESEEGFYIKCTIAGHFLGEINHHSKKLGQKELAQNILENHQTLINQITKEINDA